ncbi:hypothetical protein ACLKA6_016895 [Drosophila palustris]
MPDTQRSTRGRKTKDKQEEKEEEEEEKEEEEEQTEEASMLVADNPIKAKSPCNHRQVGPEVDVEVEVEVDDAVVDKTLELQLPFGLNPKDTRQ